MEEEISRLKNQILQRDSEISRLKALVEMKCSSTDEMNHNIEEPLTTLSSDDISKYSRQIILPEIGVTGQICLKQASVLIVGAGGLGCPVATYLTAVGVGHIGVVDHDVVDVSNLHRQVSHKFTSIGQDKSNSLISSLKEINPDVKFSSYSLLLNSSNIEGIIAPYSIIVDASDNVPTRYLLNDAAVLYNKYLVSGSALRFEGQLTVYNYKDGPCYRCLFPKPPSADAVTNCSDGGVLGAITGVIGCLQALEVIKIAVKLDPSYYKKMLLFDGLSGIFRNIKLRSRVPDCEICGNAPSIKKLIDYEAFCNRLATDSHVSISLLPESDRVSCAAYKEVLDGGKKHLLVDVRSPAELEMCSLTNSLNIPMNQILHENTISKLCSLIESVGSTENFVICRRGNDSQKAVLQLRKAIPHSTWKDIKGGLHAWHDEIDCSMPKY